MKDLWFCEPLLLYQRPGDTAQRSGDAHGPVDAPGLFFVAATIPALALLFHVEYPSQSGGRKPTLVGDSNGRIDGNLGVRPFVHPEV